MNKHRNTISAAAMIAAVALSACGGSAPATAPGAGAAKPAAESVQLNGSGATFPQPLYEDWAFAYNQADPSVTINYSGGGSGQGKKDIMKRGQGGKGNAGVAAAVQKTDGAIGYVELAFARNNNIPYAKMVNAAGKTVEATIPSTVAAIKDAQFNDKLAADIVNGQDPEAWPIAGFTYLILNKDYSDCAKAQKLVGFINWALTNQAAQDRASKLLYAPLPAATMQKTLDALKAITCQGKAVTAP